MIEETNKENVPPAELSDQAKKTIFEWAVYLGKALLDAVLLKLGFKRA